MKIESEDGYNYVALTKQETKELIKTPIGSNYQGAFVLKHVCKTVLGRKGGQTDNSQPLDEILDIIGYTYQVAFVFDGKLFANRVDAKINEDRTEWLPALDVNSFSELVYSSDLPNYYYIDGFNVSESEYI